MTLHGFYRVQTSKTKPGPLLGDLFRGRACADSLFGDVYRSERGGVYLGFTSGFPTPCLDKRDRKELRRLK